jgi:hypothetical protein
MVEPPHPDEDDEHDADHDGGEQGEGEVSHQEKTLTGADRVVSLERTANVGCALCSQ